MEALEFAQEELAPRGEENVSKTRHPLVVDRRSILLIYYYVTTLSNGNTTLPGVSFLS